VTTPREFYMQRIPEQFNRSLDEQAAAGQAGKALLDDMQAVNATMRIVVDADDGGTFYLNLEKGRMSSSEQAASEPFLTVVHDRDAFAVLEREAGDSALGFLGGLAGMGGEIKLTQSRIDNLAGMSGAVAFERTGDGGFRLLTHFGSEPVPDEAECTIRVDGDAYAKLQSGELNPQDAFLSGAIAVEGDMQMAMQLALAAMAPD